MKFFARCIDAIERRPFIFASFFLFFLIFSCFEQFLYSLYKSLLSDSVTDMFSFILDTGSKNASDLGGALEGSVNAAAGTGSLGSTLLTILIVVLLLFTLAAVVSIYFSGYFHILNASLKPNKEKAAGDFKRGLIKHYFKFTVYIFLHAIVVILTVIGAAFALFPAVLSFDMVYSGNNSLLLTSILLFLITAIVVVFIASIILMYTLYMYPALVNFKKGAAYMAKKVVNTKFWYILPRLMGFVILLALWQWFLIKIDYGIGMDKTFSSAIAAFVLNAIIKTYLVFSILFFVFFTFRQIKNALQTDESEQEGLSASAEELPQTQIQTQTPMKKAPARPTGVRQAQMRRQ